MKFEQLLRQETQNSANNPKYVQLLSGLLEKYDRYDKDNPLAVADNQKITKIVQWADQQGYLQELGLDQETVAMMAHAIVVDHKLPPALLENPKIRQAITQALTNQTLTHTPIKPEEAAQIAELLISDELFSDIAYTLVQVFKLGDSPLSMWDRRMSLFRFLWGFPKALISDISPIELIKLFSEQLSQLKNGKAPKTPEILNNTLKNLYSLFLINDIIKTVHALLSPENQSLRIALLIYARLHHVNLEQQDIDKVNETVFNTENPQLGTLLFYAIKRAPDLKGN